MASKCVEDVVAAQQTVFVCPLDKVCRLTGIQVSAEGGLATIRITDTFTPTASNGVASPSEVTDLIKKIMYVPDNTTYSWTDETKSIKILGTCEVSGVAAADSDVTVMWE